MNALAGIWTVEDIRLEYQLISLEYIEEKSLVIEAVCLNPHIPYPLNKEVIFKYNTTNFNQIDQKCKIALSLLNLIIENLELKNVKKLNIKDGRVFYLCLI